jgi:transposase-like protein
MTNKSNVFVLNHRDGSRKSKVHAKFNSKGPEVAKKFAQKLGIKDTTINSWFSQFRKETLVLAAQAKRAERKAQRIATQEVAQVA